MTYQLPASYTGYYRPATTAYAQAGYGQQPTYGYNAAAQTSASTNPYAASTAQYPSATSPFSASNPYSVSSNPYANSAAAYGFSTAQPMSAPYGSMP